MPMTEGWGGVGNGDGDWVFTEDRVSLGKLKHSGDGWWGELHSSEYP